MLLIIFHGIRIYYDLRTDRKRGNFQKRLYGCRARHAPVGPVLGVLVFLGPSPSVSVLEAGAFGGVGGRAATGKRQPEAAAAAAAATTGSCGASDEPARLSALPNFRLRRPRPPPLPPVFGGDEFACSA